MNKFVILAAAALAGISLSSHAQSERAFADIYTDCGLGAIIAPENDAVAAVTNVTWDLGTTAISSHATTPESCKGGRQAAAALIHQAYPSVEKDLVAGQGEYLTALMLTSGCAAGAQPEVVAALRQDFAGIVAAQDYPVQSQQVKSENLYNMVVKRLNTDFASACPSLI